MIVNFMIVITIIAYDSFRLSDDDSGIRGNLLSSAAFSRSLFPPILNAQRSPAVNGREDP